MIETWCIRYLKIGDGVAVEYPDNLWERTQFLRVLQEAEVGQTSFQELRLQCL